MTDYLDFDGYVPMSYRGFFIIRDVDCVGGTRDYFFTRRTLAQLMEFYANDIEAAPDWNCSSEQDVEGKAYRLQCLEKLREGSRWLIPQLLV